LVILKITKQSLGRVLKQLVDEGYVVQREGANDRRQRLSFVTPKGEALEPVFDALLVWGMDHALGPPRGREAIHPGRTMDAMVRYLARRRPRGLGRPTWVFRFGDDRSYTIRFDGARWTRQHGEAPADVIVQTSPDEWVSFLSADVEGRRRWLRTRRAKGTKQRLDELATAFGAAPSGSGHARRGRAG